MTRSKDKGTAAESLVVKYLQSTYWPYAERRALSGGLDKGDITGTPGLAWEVKAAKTLCVPAWLRETETERINAKADHAILVIKPVGVGAKNVGDFYALMDFDLFGKMMDSMRESYIKGECWYFDTTIRKTGIAQAMRIVSPRLEYLAIARYPKFVLTSLDRMVRFLLLAGYGSNDKREKDQA